MKKRIILAVAVLVIAAMFSFQEWQINKLNKTVAIHDQVLGQIVTFLNQAIEANKAP